MGNDRLRAAMTAAHMDIEAVARAVGVDPRPCLKVRIALVDPDCAETRKRDELERLGGTLPARIRTTLQHLEPLATCLAWSSVS